jgi:hypothetical protein
MATAQPTAGADTDAYCNKCKLVLAHVIIAVKNTARGSRPARVECKTCGAVHAFRAEAPGAKKKTTRRSSAKSAAAAQQADYEGLMEGRDIAGADKYKMTQIFSEKDVVNHKTFGVGLVMRVLSDDKIEVSFPAALKILVHNR